MCSPCRFVGDVSTEHCFCVDYVITRCVCFLTLEQMQGERQNLWKCQHFQPRQHIYVYVCVCVYIYIRTHTYTYTYIINQFPFTTEQKETCEWWPQEAMSVYVNILFGYCPKPSQCWSFEGVQCVRFCLVKKKEYIMICIGHSTY